MLFCENGTQWSNVWSDGGINRCFFESSSSLILFCIVFCCGIVQWALFRSDAIILSPRQMKKSIGDWCQITFTLVLIIEAVLHVVLADVYLREHHLHGYQVLNVFMIVMACSTSLWLMGIERKSILPKLPSWGHGTVLLIYWSLFFVKENLYFVSFKNHVYWWQLHTSSDAAELALFIIRYVTSLGLLILGFLGPSVNRTSYALADEENQDGPQQHPSTWRNVLVKMRMMFPFVWPKREGILQITIFICLLCLGAGRAVNVLVPIYSKDIVNSMTYTRNSVGEELTYRWGIILVWTLLVFLRGGGTGSTGLLNNIRGLLWIKVQQYTTRTVQVKLFSHLHSLSLRWHLGRKTGEVLRVIDRGTNSINHLLSYLVFQIVPTIADIVIAIIYFVTYFNYVFGLIVFSSMVLYLVVTFAITEWRTKFRRQMNLKDNAANARAVDSLLNFETVKYYEASDYERDRYAAAILEYQREEWKATASLNLLNLSQNIVNTIGLAAGSLLCAWAVVEGFNRLDLTVGDYVLFGTYMTQLYVPLNWLGTYYRMIQQSFIDMENMFDLLGVNIDIQDVPGAKAIEVKGGKIEFDDVSFHYDPSKAILKNVSFSVPAGETYALVGHTGSGKSTIVRLLFRFYNVQSGVIRIDGQDISKITQKSLRQNIGVVPQDTVLFNHDIRYNIRYGKVGATDEEVEEAGRNAEIHDRILTFPNKYDTVVGERGLKLSGGEKQRVAIARTLLKAPTIVLLDEATSALDTKTERHIQSSLAKVCENRTTIIVAHRLSTIIHAHQIIVLSEGEIIESGTHTELLKKRGNYAEMWEQQLINQNNSEEVEPEEKRSCCPSSIENGCCRRSEKDPCC